MASPARSDAELQERADHQPADPGASWRPAVQIGLTLWAASRVVLLLVAWVVPWWRQPITGRLRHGLPWPFASYARWDAGHFLRIAGHGYFSRGRDDLNVAFFPGYPITGRWLSSIAAGFGHVTLTERVVTFALLTWAAAAVAAVLLWKWIDEAAGSVAATVGTSALLFGPYGMFLMADYSEGSFLACAVGAWLMGRRGRWPAAGALAAAAALIRIDGLFLLVGLLVMYAADARATGKPLLRRDALTLPLPVVGVAAYFGWLWFRTGYWDAWSRAQSRGWNRTVRWPWQTLERSIDRYRADLGSIPAHVQAGFELVFAALYVVVLVWLFRRRMWPEFWYVGCAAAALLSSSFYQSVPRSFLVAFPVFLLLGRLTASRRGRTALVLLAVVSGALFILNAALFVRGYPVG